MSGFGLRQRQAEGGVWQTEVIVHMIQDELLVYALLTFAEGGSVLKVEMSILDKQSKGIAIDE